MTLMITFGELGNTQTHMLTLDVFCFVNTLIKPSFRLYLKALRIKRSITMPHKLKIN